MLRELRGAASLAAPAVGPGCGSSSLALVPGAGDADRAGPVRVGRSARGAVARLVVQSRRRRRHGFRVTYFDAAGRPVEPAEGDALDAAELSSVRSVGVRITLCSGRATTGAEWVAALRSVP